jgi:hypothetical protein
MDTELDEIEPDFADAVQNASMFASHAADRLTWDGVDLKEAFGIPDVVAPVRLPDDEALTALAVAAPLLADLRSLARDVREAPVRAVSVDPLLLGLAAEAELMERDGTSPVDYLTSPQSSRARELARTALAAAPADPLDLWELL